MDHKNVLTDEQWERLAPIVDGLRSRGLRPTSDRLFIEAIAWVLRTGAPWRDLPRSFGKWNSVYRRFRRWAETGRWVALLRMLAGCGEDDGLLLIDSTIVKAHPHAAGVRKRGAGSRAKRWGGRAAASRRRSMPLSPGGEGSCVTC